MMNITRAKRFTPLRGPPSGRRGGMTMRRSVETLFCTASDSMAEKLNSHDELEFTVVDTMLANLTLSPPQTSTQLTVVAEPPKTCHKGKGRGKKTKTTVCVPQYKHKGKETDSMVQCHLCQLWVHCECVGERPETIIGVWSCHVCNCCSVL